jgi:hypothetical protein
MTKMCLECLEVLSTPPSEDDYLEGPATFEQGGLTIEYMPEGRE